MVGSLKTACQAWKVMLVVIACLVAHGRPFYTNQAGEQTGFARALFAAADLQSPRVRAEICAGLAHLGVTLDATSNDVGASITSAPTSHCLVRVVRTDEDVIARHARRLLGGG
jgi:acetate kinase